MRACFRPLPVRVGLGQTFELCEEAQLLRQPWFSWAQINLTFPSRPRRVSRSPTSSIDSKVSSVGALEVRTIPVCLSPPDRPTSI